MSHVVPHVKVSLRPCLSQGGCSTSQFIEKVGSDILDLSISIDVRGFIIVVGITEKFGSDILDLSTTIEGRGKMPGEHCGLIKVQIKVEPVAKMASAGINAKSA